MILSDLCFSVQAGVFSDSPTGWRRHTHRGFKDTVHPKITNIAIISSPAC